MSHNVTFIFQRIMEMKNLRNLEELAEFLGIQYGTLRNQKRRGTIPYDEIVSRCNAEDLAYVLKGDRTTQHKPGLLKDEEIQHLRSELKKVSESVEDYTLNPEAYKKLDKETLVFVKKLEAQNNHLKGQVAALKDVVNTLKRR